MTIPSHQQRGATHVRTSNSLLSSFIGQELSLVVTAFWACPFEQNSIGCMRGEYGPYVLREKVIPFIPKCVYLPW